MELIKHFISMCKIRITIASTLTTAAGFFLWSTTFDVALFAVTITGVFLLACGSAVLNNVQEVRFDAMMNRTKNRPIPTGLISIREALLFSCALLLIGCALLLVLQTMLPLYLGLLALVWYNVIYTYLKRITMFAVVPGSLIGAIPPAIGWAAAGGPLMHPEIIAVCLFFFIWQIPHFWLLLLNFGDDYQQAGLPSLTALFSTKQLARITFIWIVAAGVTSLLIPLSGAIRVQSLAVILVVALLGLIAMSFRIMRPGENKTVFRFAFRAINVFALIVIVLISVDGVL